MAHGYGSVATKKELKESTMTPRYWGGLPVIVATKKELKAYSSSSCSRVVLRAASVATKKELKEY